KQLPALCREELDRRKHVLEDFLAREVVEAQTQERELCAEVACRRLTVHPRRPLAIDRVEAVHVPACAEAAAPCLDAEEVVEERGDEVRVQEPAARIAQTERQDREPLELRIPEDLDPWVRTQRRKRALCEVRLAAPDLVDADGLLQCEHEPCPDRLDD